MQCDNSCWGAHWSQHVCVPKLSARNSGSAVKQELVLWNLKGLQEGEFLKKPTTGAKSAKDGIEVL